MRTTETRLPALSAIRRSRSAQSASHFRIGGVGHSLAVILDGAHALVAGSHQGVPPPGKLGDVDHQAPALAYQPRWSMKPAP